MIVVMVVVVVVVVLLVVVVVVVVVVVLRQTMVTQISTSPLVHCLEVHTHHLFGRHGKL